MLRSPAVTRGPDREQSDIDILKLFVESPDPVLFAQEVADAFSKSDEWARVRLKELINEGYVNAKKPGHKSRVYWITERGHRYYADSASSGNQ